MNGQIIVCCGVGRVEKKGKCPNCLRFGKWFSAEYYAPAFECKHCGYHYNEDGFWIEGPRGGRNRKAERNLEKLMKAKHA